MLSPPSLTCRANRVRSMSSGTGSSVIPVKVGITNDQSIKSGDIHRENSEL